MFDELIEQATETAQTLSRALLNPQRGALEQILAIANECRFPQEAWSRYQSEGLVPEPPEKGRAFLDIPDTGLCVTGNAQRYPRHLGHPPTIRACASVASVHDGILLVEAEVGAVVRALRPWGCKRGPIVWDVIVPQCKIPRSIGWCSEYNVLGRAAEEAFMLHTYEQGRGWKAKDYGHVASQISSTAEIVVSEGHRSPGVKFLFARCLFESLLWWRVACKLDLITPVRFDDGWKLPKAVRERPFASLPDPFAPMLKVLLAGHAIADVDSATALLVTPRLEGNVLTN